LPLLVAVPFMPGQVEEAVGPLVTVTDLATRLKQLLLIPAPPLRVKSDFGK
jgi:hypothetical protein